MENLQIFYGITPGSAHCFIYPFLGAIGGDGICRTGSVEKYRERCAGIFFR